MKPTEIAQLYFDLSNKSAFEGTAKLFTDETVYRSVNAGDYVGIKDILTMQKAFHGKFKKLHWHVNSVEETKPGTVLFDYDFSATTKDGEQTTSSGLEYVKVANGKITRVEIENK